jgi:putative heme degradation protein
MDPAEVDAVLTREDLATFVLALREDLLANQAAWANPTQERFLEALAAWCTDMPCYFLNRGEEQPEQPDWKLVARMLMAASVYE